MNLSMKRDKSNPTPSQWSNPFNPFTDAKSQNSIPALSRCLFMLLWGVQGRAIGPVGVVLLLLSSMLQKVVYPSADPLAYRKLAFTATLFAGVLQSTFGLCKIQSINLACH